MMEVGIGDATYFEVKSSATHNQGNNVSLAISNVTYNQDNRVALLHLYVASASMPPFSRRETMLQVNLVDSRDLSMYVARTQTSVGTCF